MKRLLPLMVVLWAFAAGAQTHIYFNAAQFNANPATNRIVEFQLLTPFVGNLETYTTDTNGGFYRSNASVGDYAFTIRARGTASAIPGQFTVTATNLGVINAATNTSLRGVQTYPTSGRTAWSIQAADARYAVAGGGGLAFIPQAGAANLTNWAQLGTNVLSGIAASQNAITNYQPEVALGRIVATNLFTGDGSEITNLLYTSLGNAALTTIAANALQTASGVFTARAAQSNNYNGTFTGSGANVTNVPFGALSSSAVATILSNNYAGSFSGTIANATNLSGTNIQVHTISTNQMDAVAFAAFTASSGGGDVLQAGLAAGTYSVSATNIRGNVTNVILQQVSPTYTNAKQFIGYGGMQLSSAQYGDSGPLVNYRSGGLEWFSSPYTLPYSPTEGGFAGDADIKVWRNWGGATLHEPTLHIGSAGAMRLEPAFARSYTTLNRYLSLLNEDMPGYLQINHVEGGNGGRGSTGADMLGYSMPTRFQAKSRYSSNQFAYFAPGIMGWATQTNVANSEGYHMGELHFYSAVPSLDYTAATVGVNHPNDAVEVGRTLTNGWRFFGNVEYKSSRYVNYDSTNIMFDFNSDSLQSVDLISTLTNFIQLTNINPHGGDSIVAKKVFTIRTGALGRSLRWPTNVTVLSESGVDVLPTYLPAISWLRLEFESWGDGETNVSVSYKSGTDRGWFYDTDAADFFVRASISDATQKAAVDFLAKTLKRENLWTNNAVIYPFVGGSSSTHAYNLINSSYTITWAGGSPPTHNANGITGTTSGYGRTGFVPSTALGAQGRTNCFMAVYNRTATPVNSGRFIGCTGTSGGRFALMRNGTTFGYDGPMSSIGPASGPSAAGDWRGFIGIGRDATQNDQLWITTRSAVTVTSHASEAVAADEVYLLSRNAGGSFDATDANIAYASMGWSFTETQWATYRDIVQQYETLLGRNVP